MKLKKNFESDLQELEQIVKQMERGELSLEDAVKKYEAGMKLSKHCLCVLDKIEEKISLLTKDNDQNIKEKPFFDE